MRLDQFARLALVALLLLVLAVLVVRAVTRERRDYALFKRMTDTRDRQRVYRRWLAESWVVLGGLSAVLLLATWPLLGPALRSTQRWAPIAALRADLATPVGAAVGIGIGVLILAAMVLPIVFIRGRVDEIPAVGDVRALLPRNRDELRFGAGLGLTAGVVEEALFRLTLPALMFGIVGDGVLAFAASAVVFGLLHVYQGPLGVLFATLLGLLFAFAYVVTGWLLVPMALHAVLDLRSLVLIPALLGGAWRRPAPAPDPAA
ncbi:MAG TPA: CPBP family intramembrane glutamic endopeptidase [Pseudolysinimonas sp.]|nr:CPBP family intramembrane glutamic endopeptidase [Pseudolysinimonas sp.]